ncbi:TetR/AcrR family transcriptional regulator [Cellulomonas sp. S1-8]|uniref:TetR/AcrR family transcriptional regulator n=1 Tax=Cellulomonas sp. S1-8 TaxID=2904790 RepID=UPI002243198C|nr:TetR/AcrR family transcriptional regulator [Cellulomonas sp. S1-8]UZN03456.1 TetR/AcrR family transcriptional regulator [Cellulomonas sp. S1-8]
MAARAQTAAETRQALLDAASALLDRGGVDAVTLRDVGSGAGVSRSAPYRHFADKDDLLAAVAAAAWTTLTEDLRAVVAGADDTPAATLRSALDALVRLGRGRPHLYRLMFVGIVGPPVPGSGAEAVATAASAAQDEFLVLVERVVGAARARPTAGVLLAATHGVVDLDVSGHLPAVKWGADADALLDLLVRTVAAT